MITGSLTRRGGVGGGSYAVVADQGRARDLRALCALWGVPHLPICHASWEHEKTGGRTGSQANA